MFNKLFSVACMNLSVACLGLLLSPAHAQAKIFRNAYVSFELPDTWKCVLEHTEWVCRSEIDKQAKEAIIILTAKEVGPTDSFESYVTHLSVPLNTSSKLAGVPSKIIYPPKRIQINDQPWVDGLHIASEIPNYYTRYLATIKDKVAVLVTFSAHSKFYTNYSQDFFKAVQSLRVIAAKNLLGRPDVALRPGGESLGAPISASMPADMTGAEPPPPSRSGSSKTKTLLFSLAGLLLAGAVFILLKMKK